MTKKEEDAAWHRQRCEYYFRQASNQKLTIAERARYANEIQRLLLAP